MPDTVFSTFTPAVETPKADIPEPEVNNEQVESKDLIEAPVENASQEVLNVLGIDDSIRNMPVEDQDNLKEVANYITDVLKAKSIENTPTNFKNTLNDIKREMGLAEGAEVSEVLDRIGGVAKAWKSLSFITDAKEKKSIFMKLATMEDSKAMNKYILDVMEGRKVWI